MKRSWFLEVQEDTGWENTSEDEVMDGLPPDTSEESAMVDPAPPSRKRLKEAVCSAEASTVNRFAAVLAMLLLGAACGSSSEVAERTEEISRALQSPVAVTIPRTTVPRAPVIEYRWSGTARGVNLTLTNSDGNTMQRSNLENNHDVSLGRVAVGEFLYLSVQNIGDSGSVSCEILSDGKVISSAESSGAYVIASCKASSGDS